MKPELTKTAGGYKLTWQSDNVTVNVTRVRETKTYTSCYIVVSTNAGHLKEGNLSLTNIKERTSLAKELTTLYPIDWSSILEQLCVLVLREIRRGEPVYVLGEGVAERPEWLCEPFILANQPSVIFGAPSSGKSTFALILAAYLSTGYLANNCRMTVPAASHRILYLDWETYKGGIEWQLQCIKKGMGIEVNFPVFYRRCSVPLADDIEEINNVAEEYQVDGIWVDSLGLAAGGDLNSPEAALRFFSALRVLNRTPLLLAHNARGGENTDKHIFGSMFFEATARNIWEIVKTQDDDDSMSIGLYHKKPPPFSKMYPPMGYRIDFTDDSTLIEWQDPKSVDELVKRMSANTQILEILKRGRMSTSKIVEETGLKADSVRVSIHRLKSKGLIIKMGDDYCLPARQ